MGRRPWYLQWAFSWDATLKRNLLGKMVKLIFLERMIKFLFFARWSQHSVALHRYVSDCWDSQDFPQWCSGELGFHNCAHDFGSYTSDAICECNPQPNGTCPSGAFKVPLSFTRASMVPLKKRFISCFIKELHHQWVHRSTCQPCRRSQALRGPWVKLFPIQITTFFNVT